MKDFEKRYSVVNIKKAQGEIAKDMLKTIGCILISGLGILGILIHGKNLLDLYFSNEALTISSLMSKGINDEAVETSFVITVIGLLFTKFNLDCTISSIKNFINQKRNTNDYNNVAEFDESYIENVTDNRHCFDLATLLAITTGNSFFEELSNGDVITYLFEKNFPDMQRAELKKYIAKEHILKRYPELNGIGENISTLEEAKAFIDSYPYGKEFALSPLTEGEVLEELLNYPEEKLMTR